MNLICDHATCTGCSSCYNSCRVGAISMEEKGPFGHLYPVIDETKCMNCGACLKSCPVLSPVNYNVPRKAFAVTSKDLVDLETSSSGGAASVLSRFILSKNGIVYGCVQRNYKTIRHERISSESDVQFLKKSKYVQSNILLTFQNVRKDLKDGLTVMFLGTPCQVAGLYKFLGKEYDNLLTVDLVCHGVPSQKSLQFYIKEVLNANEREDGNYIVEFRRFDKKIKKLITGVFLFDHNKESLNIPDNYCLIENNGFTSAFYGCMNLRSSCYNCKYAQSNRVGDFTLGDFWGIRRTKINTENGISLVLTNSEKAENLMMEVQSYFNVEEHPLKEAIKGNGRLNKPAVAVGNRETYISLYQTDLKKADIYACQTYKEYLTRIKPSLIKRMLIKIKLLLSEL